MELIKVFKSQKMKLYLPLEVTTDFCSKNALALVNEIIENGYDYVCSIKYTDQNWRPIRNGMQQNQLLLNFYFGRQVAHFGYFAKKSSIRIKWIF